MTDQSDTNAGSGAPKQCPCIALIIKGNRPLNFILINIKNKTNSESAPTTSSQGNMIKYTRSEGFSLTHVYL